MKADYIVWVTCCVMITFYVGIKIGAQNKPLACPVVPGQQVVSTIDSKTDQVCVYAPAYGRALRRVRL